MHEIMPQIKVLVILAFCCCLQVYATPRIPREEQLLLEEYFHLLCSLKPSDSVGNEWTLPMQRSILDQISKPADSEEQKYMNKLWTETIVTSAVSNCDREHEILQDQEHNARQVENVATTGMGVENFFSNVFSGNLYGILKASVGNPSMTMSPQRVTSTMTNAFSTFLTNVRNTFSNFAFGASVSTSTTKPYDDIIATTSTISPEEEDNANLESVR